MLAGQRRKGSAAQGQSAGASAERGPGRAACSPERGMTLKRFAGAANVLSSAVSVALELTMIRAAELNHSCIVARSSANEPGGRIGSKRRLNRKRIAS